MEPARCPRCRGAVAEPTVLEPSYVCSRHGRVPALMPPLPYHATTAADLAARSDVPVWLPDPLPGGWLLTGLRSARTARRRACASVVGISGRGLDAGPTDVLILAEEPGCGLGSSYAGLDGGGPDPGPDAFAGPPAVHVRTRVGTSERLAGLWSLPAAGRCVFLGEAEGSWLWLVGWPQTAWALLEDGLQLADARSDVAVRTQPAGAVNPRV